MSASAGTLLASALETAGFEAQEAVLRDLAPMYIGISGFLFTAVIMMAIGTYALQGDYQMKWWLLLTPALFIFVVNTRVEVEPSEWTVGAYKLEGQVKGAQNKAANEKSNVSWVFAKYNDLVSSVVRNLSNVILNGQLKRQMMFSTRQRIMNEIIAADNLDGNLRELINLGLQGDCGKELESARREAAARRDYELRSAIDTIHSVDSLKTYYKADKAVSIANLRPYLRDVLNQAKRNGGDTWVFQRWCPNVDADLSKDVDTLVNQPQSCSMIWCWTGLAFASQANGLIKEAADKYISEDLAAKYDGKYQSLEQEIWHNIAIKLTPDNVLTSANITGEPPSEPQFQRDVSVIPAVISGILLRKTLTTDPRSQAYTQFAKHSGVERRPLNFNPKLPREDMDRMQAKYLNHHMAQGLRWEAFNFAMMLPYLQGFLLYIAALTFPFFAILLVIPGKAQNFLMWMALWAWLKSWDIGWSLVYVADDIIWNLMPHHSAFNPEVDPTDGPIGLFESAFDGDPSYSLSTYYMLVGVMMNAVPMLSAQVVLGAKSAVAGQLVGGVKSMAEKLGGWRSDYVANQQSLQLKGIGDAYRAQWTMQQINKGADKDKSGLSNPFNDTIRAKRDEAIAGLSEGRQAQLKGFKGGVSGAGEQAIGGGLAVGGFGVAGGTLLLSSNPAGWVVAVGLGIGAIGTAVAGHGTVKEARSNAEHSAGVYRQKASNKQLAQLVTLNGQAWYERSNYSRAALNLGALNQSVLNRGQYYDPVGSQDHIHTDLTKIGMNYQSADVHIDAYLSGAESGAGFEGATRAIFGITGGIEDVLAARGL